MTATANAPAPHAQRRGVLGFNLLTAVILGVAGYWIAYALGSALTFAIILASVQVFVFALAVLGLATLVAYGVMEREPYQEPGARSRSAYRLTPAGRELRRRNPPNRGR